MDFGLLAKVLRGSATPAQLVAACLLGSLLGFVPSLAAAPALWLLWALLLVVLNANLGLALLSWTLAKLLSLLLMPVSFALGRVLLDGPTGGLFALLINAPVTAWMGLERYVTAGGLVLGALVGALLGWIVVRTVTGFRRTMAGHQQSDDRVARISESGLGRVLAFLLFGGRVRKVDYAELLQPRRVRPVRLTGLVLLALLAAGVGALHAALTGPLVTRYLRSGLERVNGATVDLEEASLDLGGGKLLVRGLAMADPHALDTDLFRAETLEADLGTRELLRKRLVIDRIVVAGAAAGRARESRGRSVGAEPQPPILERLPDEKELEDVLARAEEWRERLLQIRRWLDALAGGEPETEDETLEERLEKEVRLHGWREVVAHHLVEKTPLLVVREVRIEGLDVPWLGGDVLDLRAASLSTEPWLVDSPAQLSLSSRSGRLEASLGLAGFSRGGGGNDVSFAVRELDIDSLGLQVAGRAPVQGGTLDASLQGTWSAGRVGELDLPLQVTLHDTQIEGRSVPQLQLSLGVRGPIDDPAIRLDAGALADALVAAGQDELARRARGELDERVGEAQEKLGEAAQGVLDGLFKTKDG